MTPTHDTIEMSTCFAPAPTTHSPPLLDCYAHDWPLVTRLNLQSIVLKANEPYWTS